MSAAFTPGPWYPYHSGAPRTICADVERDGATFLERVALVKDTPDGLPNARLIAAAPKLYKYLELALAVLDRSNTFWGGYDNAVAALAEARGEAL